MNTKQICKWMLADDDAGLWETSCNNAFVFTEGTPNLNKFAFCPYCGGTLRVKSVITVARMRKLA